MPSKCLRDAFEMFLTCFVNLFSPIKARARELKKESYRGNYFQFHPLALNLLCFNDLTSFFNFTPSSPHLHPIFTHPFLCSFALFIAGYNVFKGEDEVKLRWSWILHLKLWYTMHNTRRGEIEHRTFAKIVFRQKTYGILHFL